jgi:hypothetical protein
LSSSDSQPRRPGPGNHLGTCAAFRLRHPGTPARGPQRWTRYPARRIVHNRNSPLKWWVPDVDSVQTTLLDAQDDTKAAGIRASGTGGCFLHGLPLRAGLGLSGLAGPRRDVSDWCVRFIAKWEVGQNGLQPGRASPRITEGAGWRWVLHGGMLLPCGLLIGWGSSAGYERPSGPSCRARG